MAQMGRIRLASVVDSAYKYAQIILGIACVIIVGIVVSIFFRQAEKDAGEPGNAAKKTKTNAGATPVARERAAEEPRTEPAGGASLTPRKPDQPPAIPLKISPEIRKVIEERYNSLNPYYQRTYLTDAERSRLQRVMSAIEPTQEDLDFLQFKVIAEAVARSEQEINYFKTRVEELTRQCQLELAAEIKRGLKDGYRTMYDKKIQEAEGDVDLLNKLAGWCRNRKLKTQEDLALIKILLIDPAHEGARTAFGFAKTEATGRAESTPTVYFDGARLTEAQLLDRLAVLGYVQIDGKWHKKGDWSYVFDTVHKPDQLKWSGSDVSIQDAKEQASTSQGYVQPGQGAAPGPIKQAANQKFFAPKQAAGTLKITIDAPGPLVSATLRAPAMVSENKGTVELLVGEAKPQRVYLIERGSDDRLYDISDKVQGQKRLVLTVVMKMTPDPMMQHARFLPSAADSKGVLAVRATVAVLDPDIERLFKLLHAGDKK